MGALSASKQLHAMWCYAHDTLIGDGTVCLRCESLQSSVGVDCLQIGLTHNRSSNRVDHTVKRRAMYPPCKVPSLLQLCVQAVAKNLLATNEQPDRKSLQSLFVT